MAKNFVEVFCVSMCCECGNTTTILYNEKFRKLQACRSIQNGIVCSLPGAVTQQDDISATREEEK